MNNNVKILISCHKQSVVPDSKVLVPMEVGAALREQHLDGMVKDNTGDNISGKNRMYCEMTAQYWAWKNLNADYYGFMHYRRYFSFADKELKEDKFGNIIYNRLDAEGGALDELGYNDDTIRDFISRYDVLTVVPQDVYELDGSKSVYEHYCKSEHHRGSDLDTVKEIISEKYPDYVKAMNDYLNGRTSYFCNMYILKKNAFFDYMKWVFDILEEHERRSDFEDYDKNEYRVSGFLAERLWGIYYTKIRQDGSLKYKELQKTHFNNTEVAPNIQPAFKEHNIPIVIAADDKYVPYVTVMLRSLIENASKERNYDVIALHSSISKSHQQEICKEFAGNTNLSIRFYNIAYMYSGIDLHAKYHITVETFYRLLMQDIMKNYDKVLYIDSDLVVLGDISELYDTDMTDYCLGAVKDIDMAGNYHDDPERRAYFADTLTMSNPYDYVNAGVLVMNLAEFRKNFSTDQIMNTIAQNDWLYMDQDILNYLCDGKIKHLDMSWNVVMNWVRPFGSRMRVMENAPHQIYFDYMESRKHPKIAHYAGFSKPWNEPECDMAEYFWKYAEMTDVFEELNRRLEEYQNEMKHSQHSEDYHDGTKPLIVDGVDEPIYVDGMYVKLINKLNRWFPIGSTRRSILKKLAGGLV